MVPPSIPSHSYGLLSLIEKERTNKEESLPGPGHYEERKKKKINSKGTVWAKDKIRRFKLENSNDVGPGQYIREVNQKK